MSDIELEEAMFKSEMAQYHRMKDIEKQLKYLENIPDKLPWMHERIAFLMNELDSLREYFKDIL